jgi:hypothetical protein
MIGKYTLLLNHSINLAGYLCTRCIQKENKMKKSAIIISILITTLVLGTVAGVVKAVSVSKTNAKVQELEQTIQAREELYKQTIEEANTRLAEFQTNPAGNPTASVISADKAIQNARTAVGSYGLTMSSPPVLVNYNGSRAYEINSWEGIKLYVDSLSGAVLFNSLTGSAAKVVTDQEAIQAALNYMPGYVFASISKSVYNGQQVDIVTFTSGDQVYVNLAGQVVYLAQMQVQTASYYGGGGGGGGGSGSSGRGEREGGDD